MFRLTPRTALLTICTLAAFATGGRAPGAVNLRTREIEISLAGERKAGGREGSAWLDWPDPGLAG